MGGLLFQNLLPYAAMGNEPAGTVDRMGSHFMVRHLRWQPMSLKKSQFNFGPTISEDAGGYTTEQPYKYNGRKELEEEINLQYYDYGARMYNSQIGRWNSVDPLAHKYQSYSTYNYALNNPIIFKDNDGGYVEGMEGKPVFNFQYKAETRRIGNAMMKTEIGGTQFKKMQETNYPIGVHLNNPGDGDFGKSYVQGSFDEKGKFNVARADKYVNEGAMKMWKNGYDEQTKSLSISILFTYTDR